MAKWRRHDEATQDLLLLVSIDVSLATIASWTNEQVQEAEAWAGATHARASDNVVRRRAKPVFLPDFMPPDMSAFTAL